MSVYETSITNPKKQLEFYKDLSKQLEQENQELKQKINTYENPNDLTLMFMYCNEKARDMIEELKKQLEEYEYHLKISKEMLDLQGQDGNYNYDNYMLGLYNGMEYIISLFEKRESIYKNGKDIDFLEDKNKNQLRDKSFEELKKQLEEMDSKLFFTKNELEMRQKSIDDKLNQQKEFIEWLESNLEVLEMCDRELILTNNKKEIKAYKEILSKYKEIIGAKDE